MKKRIKKLVAGFTAAAIMFGSAGILPEGVFSGFSIEASAETSGTCGENLTWTLDDEGTLTISGTGNMTNYAYYNKSPFYYEDSIKTVVIENGVTSIGSDAFYGCSGLTSITIPDSVTSIGDDAFNGCSALTNITIPNSVTSIGEYAFSQCYDLTSITIPDSVTSIGGGAFEGCSDLASIIIPRSVTSIGSYAFYGCSGLTSISIPDSVTSIGIRAFCSCSGLKSINIGNSVTSIGDGAFWGSGLTSVTIPDSVTSIGDSAFRNSGLTSITIPNSVISIGKSAFNSCSGLTSINVDKNNESYKDIEGVLFNKDVTEIITYPEGKIAKSYIIPNSVTSIGDSAFSGCDSLTSITIPDSVTSIGDSAFRNSGLTSITIPDNVTSISDSAFEYCFSLKSITIPESVIYIGISAFSGCDSLTSITIPESVTSIGNCAFYDCYGLTSITIPDSVTSIGIRAFEHCQFLKNVKLGNSVTSIGEYAFSQCFDLTSITIPDNVTSIGEYAFSDCSGLTSVNIGNSVTSISDDVFAGCFSLISINIPDSVTSIGYGAFGECSALKSITIPDSVTSIGDYAFWECSGLTSITILDSIISIGEGAFNKCNSLTDIYYTGTEEQWSNISGIDSANIPENCVIHYNYVPIKLISIKVIPTKTDYFVGENIDVSGGKITILYRDGNSIEIAMTSEMISGFDSATAGNKTITVIYEGYTSTFSVLVKARKVVTSISVNVPNNAKRPIEGEALDLTGYTLTVKYDDKSTDTIALTANMVTGYDANKIGKQKLTVVYGGKTATFEVTVMPDPKNMPVIINGEPCDTLTNALKVWKSGALNITINKSLTEKTLTIPKTVTSATITTAPGAVLNRTGSIRQIVKHQINILHISCMCPMILSMRLSLSGKRRSKS